MALDIFTGIQRACCFCNSSQPSPLGATAMTSKYAENNSIDLEVAGLENKLNLLF